jgi:hypothetical protein
MNFKLKINVQRIYPITLSAAFPNLVNPFRKPLLVVLTVTLNKSRSLLDIGWTIGVK